MAGDRGEIDQFEDYYDLLGVDQDADRETIVAAYKHAVKTHHPDRSTASELDADQAAHLFKHLSTARSVLTNPSRRAAYDRLGHRTYLLQHGGSDDPIRTTEAGTDGEGKPAGDTSGPSWYAATTPSERTSGPAADDGDSVSGSVVEGTETAVTDLLGRDPIETAWRRFLVVWTGRVLAAGGLLAATMAGVTSLALALSVAVVALSGLVVHAVTPVTSSPTTPPASASVGLLRPAVATRWRRRGVGALVVLAGLAGLAAVGPASGTLPTQWFPRGVVGAPKLLGVLDFGMTLLAVVAVLVGPVGTAVGVSATVWLAHHGGHSRCLPTLWDTLVATGLLAVAAGTTGMTPVAGGLIPAGQPLVAGGCVLLGVVALCSVGVAQQVTTTSATTS